MTELFAPNIEVLTLMDAACSGTITSEQVWRLEAILREDEQVRDAYLGYFFMHAELSRIARLERCRASIAHRLDDLDAAASAADSISSKALSNNSPMAPPTVGSVWNGAFGYFSSDWLVAYLVATMIFGLGLLVGSLVHVPQPEQYVHQPAHDSAPLAASAQSQIIGRITGMVDCRWSMAGGQNNLKSEIRNLRSHIFLGDRFNIRSGLLEITYDTGAKVILQGPVTYEVESVAGGYLSVGKLTAKLEKANKKLPSPACGRGGGGEGGLNQNDRLQSAVPLFAVRTPTAIVTDLGTEFGVEVDANLVTHTQVFAGRVRVAPSGEKEDANRTSPILVTGQYAKVAMHQNVSMSADKATFERHAKRFTRTMPTPPKNDAANGSFRDDLAGKVSRHWINPTAAVCKNNSIVFHDRAYLRTAGDFNYGVQDFIATVKMTNADGGTGHNARGSACFGLGDGTISGFYAEPCADQFPSVYFMYPGPGWIDTIAAVHTTQASKTTPGFRKWRNIPGTKPRPAGTAIVVKLTWTAATDTAVFSIDADNDGVFESSFKATYPGLSSSEYVSRLFIGGADGVCFSDFQVTVGPHAPVTADLSWDDAGRSPQK